MEMEMALATVAEVTEANTADEMEEALEWMEGIWTIIRTHLMTLMPKEQEQVKQVSPVLKMPTVMALQELEIPRENIGNIVLDWAQTERTRIILPGLELAAAEFQWMGQK